MTVFKKMYLAWMKLAHVLGWVNTRIILTFVYFFIMTPLSLVFKLIGKDPMNRKIGVADSYWIKREPQVFDKGSYRRQF